MIIINGGSYCPDSKKIDNFLLDKIQKNDLIIFVPAATTKSQETYFEFFKKNMSSYELTNIDWIDLYSPWEKKVKDAKVIYLAGGNTFKLIDILRKSGFDKFLKESKDKLIIVGNSAGAVVLGKNISTTNDEDIIGVSNYNGLGLMPYSLCPHYTIDKKDRLQSLANKENISILGVPEKAGIVFNSEEKRIGKITEIFPE